MARSKSSELQAEIRTFVIYCIIYSASCYSLFHFITLSHNTQEAAALTLWPFQQTDITNQWEAKCTEPMTKYRQRIITSLKKQLVYRQKGKSWTRTCNKRWDTNNQLKVKCYCLAFYVFLTRSRIVAVLQFRSPITFHLAANSCSAQEVKMM